MAKFNTKDENLVILSQRKRLQYFLRNWLEWDWFPGKSVIIHCSTNLKLLFTFCALIRIPKNALQFLQIGNWNSRCLRKKKCWAASGKIPKTGVQIQRFFSFCSDVFIDSRRGMSRQKSQFNDVSNSKRRKLSAGTDSTLNVAILMWYKDDKSQISLAKCHFSRNWHRIHFFFNFVKIASTKREREIECHASEDMQFDVKLSKENQLNWFIPPWLRLLSFHTQIPLDKWIWFVLWHCFLVQHFECHSLIYY